MRKRKLEAKLSQIKKKLEKTKSELDHLRSVIEERQKPATVPKAQESTSVRIASAS